MIVIGWVVKKTETFSFLLKAKTKNFHPIELVEKVDESRWLCRTLLLLDFPLGLESSSNFSRFFLETIFCWVFVIFRY